MRQAGEVSRTGAGRCGRPSGRVFQRLSRPRRGGIIPTDWIWPIGKSEIRAVVASPVMARPGAIFGTGEGNGISCRKRSAITAAGEGGVVARRRGAETGQGANRDR